MSTRQAFDIVVMGNQFYPCALSVCLVTASGFVEAYLLKCHLKRGSQSRHAAKGWDKGARGAGSHCRLDSRDESAYQREHKAVKKLSIAILKGCAHNTYLSMFGIDTEGIWCRLG